MSYNVPGVYTENAKIAYSDILSSISSSICGLVGVTSRGKMNTAILVTSWEDYIRKFASGFDTPFLANSFLAYCVYGFFQNGGNNLYIVRTGTSAYKKASLTIDSNGKFEAIDEGTWGNSISVTVTTNATAGFDVKVTSTLNGTEAQVESYTGLSNSDSSSNYFVKVINNASSYIQVVQTGTTAPQLVAVAKTALTGGADGITGITSAEIKSALERFKYAPVNMIGTTLVSNDFNKEVSDFCELYLGKVGIIDLPLNTGVDTLAESLSNIVGNVGVYSTFLNVTNPLSELGSTIQIPSVGHIMGMCARVIEKRGVWKAPAGVEAYLKGVVSVPTLSDSDIEVFYSHNVNCILDKTGYGIVAWGARTQNGVNNFAQGEFKYISAVLLDSYIKNSLKKIMEQYVYEPNNSYLWLRVATEASAFLEALWSKGGLAGQNTVSAYKITCDSSVNTKETIANGEMICKVAYASDTPAEFIIFSVSQSMN